MRGFYPAIPRNNTHLLARKIACLLLLAPLIFSLACTLRLIGEYDEVIDRSLTGFQQKTEAFLSRLESAQGTPDASFAKNADFYTDASAAIRTMRVRANAQPKKDILVKQLDLLQKSLEDLKKLHQLAGPNGLTQGPIEDTRSAMETQIESILKLELALKRGKNSARMLPPPPALTTVSGD
jgi:hypothetical protein